MAESSSHNPPSPEITPKEEHVTLDKPESPNPFLPADQVSTPTSGIRGDIGITTFRNVLRAHYLPHSSMYVSPPSITVVRPWFATIGYNGEIKAKGTLKKSFLPPSQWDKEYKMPEYDNKKLTIHPTQVFSVLNWALKPNQHEGPPFTDHMKAIYNIHVLVDSQALKTSSQTEKVPKEKSLELKVDSEENNF
ncbi:hypothetical protein Tco_1023117 [Tanacetum coccineum]